ncbi:MAG: ABC transporter permease [Clostridiaceae bacterium]|nr:ABC transporter permease [Clostridiaceae bacterium]
MTIFNFVFKRYFRKKSNIIFLLLLPLASVFLPVGEHYEWFPLPMGFQYYGILLLFIAARLTSIVMEDRTNKTLLRIGVAPITHFQYLFQNLLAFSLILMVANFLVVVAGRFIHGEVLVSPLMFFFIYSIFSFTAIGFSLAWVSLFKNKEAAFSVLAGVFILMAILGGVMFPIQALPETFQRLAMLLPTYWLMESMQLVIRGGSLGDFILSLGMMLMFSFAFILFGSRKRLS